MNELNPYYQWFGIPKEVIGPNHYLLLGLRDTQCDESAIEEAYRSRMSILRAFEEGPHRELAERLGIEVDGAYQILVDPDDRDVYDRQIGLKKTPPATVSSPEQSQSARSSTNRTPAITSSGTAVPEIPTKVEPAPTQSTPSVSAQYRTKRQSRPKINLPLQIGLFFVPTLILVIVFSAFPGALTSITRGIRNLVYGNQPETETASTEPSLDSETDSTKLGKVKPTHQRIDKQRMKDGSELDRANLAKKSRSSKFSQQKSPSVDPQRTNSKSDSATQSNASPGTTMQQAAASRQRPDRQLVDAYLEQFKKLPDSEPAEFFELAKVESDRAKKYAIFEFGMELAKTKKRADELSLGIQLWSAAFDVDWEREFLQRILAIDYSTRGTVASVASWAPAILQACRNELCLDSGIQFCDLMLAQRDRLPRINQRYFEQQKLILSQMKELDRASVSKEKRLFEALFFDGVQAKESDPLESPFLQQLEKTEQMLRRNVKLTQELFDGELSALKKAAEPLKATAQYSATRYLINEVIDQIEVDAKTALIKQGIDWTEKSNLKYQLRESQIAQALSVNSSSEAGEAASPVILRHRTNLQVAGRLQDFGFCGETSRMVVYGDESFYLLDPVSRKLIKHPAFAQPGFDEVPHPNNYLSVAFDGRSIIWRDLFSSEKMMERLELATRTGGTPSGDIPRRFKRLAIINNRNDIVVLNGADLVRIYSPTHTKEKRLQKRIDTESQVYGLYSNGRNAIAALGANEVTIIEHEKVQRSIGLNQHVSDFIFSEVRNQYYMTTQSSLVRISDGPVLRFNLANSIQLEELYAEHLVVCRQFGPQTFLNQLIALEKSESGGTIRVLQTFLSDSAGFRLSSDKKSLAFENNGELQIYSIF